MNRARPRAVARIAFALVCIGACDAVEEVTDNPDGAADAVTVDAAVDADACAACRAGEVCGEGRCRPPASCRELRDAASPLPSNGTYSIDPGGAGGADAFDAYCDMSTSGGGWTLVFLAEQDDYQCTFTGEVIEYSELAGRSLTLMESATEALLVQRDFLTRSSVGATATFSLPSEWRSLSPMATYAPPAVLVAASIDSGTPATMRLWYGTASFNASTTNCGAADWTTTTHSGRICLDDADAPAFFDFCNNAYPTDRCGTTEAPVPCGPARRASIAVR